MTYTHKTQPITIEVRQAGKRKTAWSLFINGQYKLTKILPTNNTAIPQNFGFAAIDFI